MGFLAECAREYGDVVFVRFLSTSICLLNHPDYIESVLVADHHNFVKSKDYRAHFPFGGGPRVCIGATFAMMEAVLLLTTIAQRFRLNLVPGHPVEMLPSITLRPKNGIRVVLTPR